MDAMDKHTPQPLSDPATNNEREHDAFAHLMPLVDLELKRLEQHYLVRERTRNVGRRSELVTGGLAKQAKRGASTGGTVGNRFIDQKHFFAVCARQMRRILVNHAQGKDPGQQPEFVGSRQDSIDNEAKSAPAVIALDQALTQFERIDPAAALAFELHYFGGHDYKELAIITKLSEQSVHRQLRLARAWLLTALKSDSR
jgi:RNA polymerase sigma factor (TIGR02999 family)